MKESKFFGLDCYSFHLNTKKKEILPKIYSSVIYSYTKQNHKDIARDACILLQKLLEMIEINYNTKTTKPFTLEQVELLDNCNIFVTNSILNLNHQPKYPNFLKTITL